MLVLVPVPVVSVLLEVTPSLVWDALLPTEVLEVLVVNDAVVVELSLGVAVDVTWLKMVVAIVAALVLVPVLAVAVLPVVTLSLARSALLAPEALDVPVVDGAVVVTLSVELATDVALLGLALAVVAVLVSVPVRGVTVLLEVPEALEDPVFDGAAVVGLMVEVFLRVPPLELVLAVVAVLMFVPVPVVTVLLEVPLPLVCDALLVTEALEVLVVGGAVVVELTLKVAVSVAVNVT